MGNDPRGVQIHSALCMLWAVIWMGGGIKSEIRSQCLCELPSSVTGAGYNPAAADPLIHSLPWHLLCLNRQCLHICGDGRRWELGCLTPEVHQSLSGTRQEWAVSGGGCPAVPVLHVCLPGLGAQCCSSSSRVIAEIGIKFSFLKETVCVCFKSQLFGRKPNSLTMAFPGKWEKCQMEANVVFTGCEKQTWGSVLHVDAITAEVIFCTGLSFRVWSQHCRKSYKADLMSYLSARHGNFSALNQLQ